MKTLISLALAITLPVGALSAQDGWYPKDRETTNGNTWDNRFPFSQAAPNRAMIIIPRERMIGMDSLDIGIPVPDGKKITKIGFRRDEQNFVSQSQRLIGEIWMAKGRVDPGSESSTYQNNIEPGTEVKVLTAAAPNFLVLPLLDSSNPIAWVTLDTPYTYDASRALVIDFRITLNDNGNQAFDYRLDLETQFSSEQVPFGQACAGSGGNVPELTIDRGRIGANTVFRFSKGTANTLTGMHLNVERLPTPITAPAIAGNCELWVNPLAVIGGMTNSGGNLNVVAPIPNNLSLVGLTVYGQAFIQDFFANPLGFISSNGYCMTIGALPQAATIRSTGDALANSGSLRRNWGYVMAFCWID